jgi:hypothetical protein
MTYSYKLSRRLALCKLASSFQPMLVLLVLLCACNGADVTEPTAIDLARGGLRGAPPKKTFDSTLVVLTISPGEDTLRPAEKRIFVAKGVRRNGDTVTVSANWIATGGQITSSGEYIAGSSPGNFQVIGTQGDGALADTATVEITSDAPQLTDILLTPASVTLSAGSTQQFTAGGRMSDESASVVNVTFSATGGTITSDGLYTAGSSAGTFRVIATEQGGTLADTSSVTVTTPTPTPTPTPPPPPPLATCARTVNVSTIGALRTAISAALPGDCIMMAPGTYNLGSSNLSVTRDGTAALPITIQGAGSSTIINGNGSYGIFPSAAYVHFRKFRFTNPGVQSIWAQGLTYSVFDSLEIDHIPHAGMKFKDGSHHNIIKNTWFHDTGTLHSYWGEAIYISNSGSTNAPLQFNNTDNQILNNRFGPNVGAQAVDLKEGADRTVIRGNTIDGTGTHWDPDFGSATLVSVISSHNTIEDNSIRYGNPRAIAFYAPKTVTMAGNLVTKNRIDLYNIHNATFTVYAIDLTRNTTSNANVVVKCDNVVTNGRFSNVACTP